MESEGSAGQTSWPSHCLPQAMGGGGMRFMQHPPHLQPVFYQMAPRPMPWQIHAAHPGGLFPMAPGRLPPVAQTVEPERASGWGGVPLGGQHEASAERQFSGRIEHQLPGSLGSSPVSASPAPFPSNGAYRGHLEQEQGGSPGPTSHGASTSGHAGRHRSRDEDSATPCPFYMKTGTCAYGDKCVLGLFWAALGPLILNIPSGHER